MPEWSGRCLGSRAISSTGAGLVAAALLALLAPRPAASAKPALVSIAVQPALASLIPGQTLTLRAIGSYADGSSADITNKVVFESDSRAAKISKNLLTARELGSAEVRAIAKQGKLASAQSLQLTVSRIAALSIDPENAGVRLGSRVAWRALATLEDGATRVTVTDFVEWRSSEPRVVKVGNGKRDKGASTALRTGQAALEVRDPDSGVSERRELTVVSQLLRVLATPESRFLQLDDTGRCRAVGVFEGDVEADISGDVRWSSSDTQVAKIDKFGVTTPRRLGSAELIATDKKTKLSSADSDTNSGLTVVGELVGIALDPAVQELAVGEVERLRALGTYVAYAGNTEVFSIGRRVDWLSSAPDVAVAEADGDVHCLAPGTAIVSVRDPESGLTSTATGGDCELRCL